MEAVGIENSFEKFGWLGRSGSNEWVENGPPSLSSFLPSPTSILSSYLFISPLLLSPLWGELNRSVCHKGEKKRMMMKEKIKR